MRLFQKLVGTSSPAEPDVASTAGSGSRDATSLSIQSTSTRKQLLADVTAHDVAGRYAQSLSLIGSALAATPDDPELLFARASTLFRWGRFREALDAYLKVESLRPTQDALHVQLGWSCFYTGKLDDAEVWMRKAVAADPQAWTTHYGLASTLRGQKRTDEAVASYERALELCPDSIDCLIDLGVCKVHQGDPVGAERQLRRAIAVNLDRAMAWDNLGVALHRQDRFREAFEAFERAERLEVETGEDIDSFVNFANALRDNGQLREALKRYEGGLPQRPNIYGHGQYALALLAAGRLKEGWSQYEFRWIQEPLRSQRPPFTQPTWTGQDLRGKTILLRSEQGFGDTIQFIRYAPLVKALGATVLMQVRAGLEQLTARFPGVDRFVRAGDAIPEFDFHIHLLSLPHVFGTDINSIPTDIPYLAAEPERAERWASRIPADGVLRVGMAWAGNPTHLRDRYRSISLRSLAPLGELEGVRFYSLQKDPPAEAIELALPGLDLIEFGSELQDFCDTAAAISQLDLVICVDTAVAHLAGALGKPVWVMLPHWGDWRWLQGREESPWYPTMRLFRQNQRGEWGEVVDRVRAALRTVLSGDRPVAMSGTHLAGKPSPDLPLPTSATEVASSLRPLLSAVAETRFGILQYMPGDGVVAKSITSYGEYRQSELNLLGKLVRPDSTMMEVGAGVGIHSVFLAKALGEAGHLFLYESRPIMHRILAQNLTACRIENVTTMRRALGRPRDQALPANGATSDALPAADSVASVESETLDELQLARLDWLKINDGMQALEVLDGATDTLWRLRPNLFIATSDLGDMGKLTARVKDFGYSCWRVETGMFNPENYSHRDTDIFGGKTALSILAIPEEAGAKIVFDGCVELL